jgi:hypothetical protein
MVIGRRTRIIASTAATIAGCESTPNALHSAKVAQNAPTTATIVAAARCAWLRNSTAILLVKF